MDSIKGAKILRERLEQKATDAEPQPAATVPQDALPIFHWIPAEAEQLLWPPRRVADSGA